MSPTPNNRHHRPGRRIPLARGSMMLNVTYTKQQTSQTWKKDTSSQGEYDAEFRGSMMLNVTYTKQQTSQTWEKDTSSQGEYDAEPKGSMMLNTSQTWEKDTSSQGEYDAERHLHQITDITDLGEGYL
ncbi:hypothetical protein DPMN_188850 [Dreissena polymorpha]|uniref:Uncharacterized protein n=1 Tax=Dreissena polymorpha TaxID=45954 RepID=A0A9D4DQV6_DREPO|nr:hypothetical protein DPMN_188850 [Dreissena polymorpha]